MKHDFGRPTIGLFLLLTLCLASLAVSGCQSSGGAASGGEPAREKVALPAGAGATRNASEVVIGVAYGFSVREDLMRNGLDMAVEEINATGGVLGKKIRLRLEDDLRSVTRGGTVAQSFIDDPSVVAVIGHGSSTVSISVAAMYDRAGLALLTPSSSSPRLTQMGLSHVFRGSFNDRALASEAAQYAKSRGYRRAVVLYTDDTYGKTLANAFEDAASALGVLVVDRVCSLGNVRQFERQVDKWKAFQYDVIFVAAGVPDGIEFISVARKAGATVPIISGDGLDTPEFPRTAGAAAEDTIVLTGFHKDQPGASTFVADFKKKFGVMPDARSASAYDSVKLLAAAIQRAGAADRASVAQAMRKTSGLRGATGSFSFDSTGDSVGLSVVRTVVKQGSFVLINSN